MDLNVNLDENKVIMLEGKEGSLHEVNVDGRQFQHASEFKYLVFV